DACRAQAVRDPHGHPVALLYQALSQRREGVSLREVFVLKHPPTGRVSEASVAAGLEFVSIRKPNNLFAGGLAFEEILGYKDSSGVDPAGRFLPTVALRPPSVQVALAREASPTNLAQELADAQRFHRTRRIYGVVVEARFSERGVRDRLIGFNIKIVNSLIAE